MLGRYDEAEATVRKAIELQPQSSQSYALLAIRARRLQVRNGRPCLCVYLTPASLNFRLRQGFGATRRC